MKKVFFGFIPMIIVIMSCVMTPPSGSTVSDTRQEETVSRQSAPADTAPDELDIAIRDASDYLNDNIPVGNKIVILNIQSGSSELSDYIIDELIANAVNDRIFTVVDRQQLDSIREEQNLQLSGEVDDNLAVSIGRFFGAQTIISGTVSTIEDRYRLRIRALDVQTAQVQGQYNRNIAAGRTINALMRSGGGRSATTASPSGGNIQGTASSAPVVNEPPITGTIVPGETLAEKLAWLERSADSHNTYILEVTADENIAPHSFEYRGTINITIALRGVGENRTIRLRSNGTMFRISEGITFILDNNITLQGHDGNTGALVIVQGGTLRMRDGATITGNKSGYEGGGVTVRGTFEMTGGTITGNTGTSGGGVALWDGTFTMNGGIISNNTASSWSGGGVYTFIRTTFTMRGGTITGNTATTNGGGVSLYAGTFIKSGGTITGYNSDPNNGNVIRDEFGNALARRGHAVWISENQRKETTAGPGVNLSSASNTGWD